MHMIDRPSTVSDKCEHIDKGDCLSALAASLFAVAGFLVPRIIQ